MLISGGRADRTSQQTGHEEEKRRMQFCGLNDWVDGGGKLRLGKQISGRKLVLWFGPINLDVN